MEQDAVVEQGLMSAIYDKTGLSFATLAAIDFRKEDAALPILSILVNWQDRFSSPSYRHTLYSCFHTPFAYPYIETLLTWWKTETDFLCLSSLTQDLALVAKARDAEKIWLACKAVPQRPFHYLLLSRLAKFPSVSAEVLQEIRDALVNGRIPPDQLRFVSKVESNSRQEDSEERRERLIRRRSSKSKPLTHTSLNVVVNSIGPDRSTELFSTESDLENIENTLRLMSKQTRTRLVKGAGGMIRGASSRLEEGQWASLRVSKAGPLERTLWVRLEDVDTVEVVLIETHLNSPGVQ